MLGTAPSFAQDEEPLDRTPQDCLAVATIDRTKVIDDQTILFYMRGKKVYRNYLPRNCPNLASEDRFMYETHSSRLCSVDTITVLEQWGAGFQRGFTCKLGEFQPLSAEEAQDLERERRYGRGRDLIETKPVELPPDDDGETAAPAPAGGDADD